MIRKLVLHACALFLLAAPLAGCEENGSGYARSLPRLTIQQNDVEYWSLVDGGKSVGVKLNDQGAQKLAQLTKDHLNKPIAIYVDDVFVIAPVIHEPITSGQLLLATQDQSKEQAEKLVQILNALPQDKRR